MSDTTSHDGDSDAGMGAYIHTLQSSIDIGQNMGTAAASFYNSLIDNSVPDEYAVSLTDTFVIGFFEMIMNAQQRKPGESSPGAKS